MARSRRLLLAAIVLLGAAVGVASQGLAQTPTANSGPAGITVGRDGALWFIEQIGNNIGRITTAGAVTETFTQPTGQLAVLTTPTPGSTFAGSSVNFAWTAGSGVSQYFLYVGSVLGGNDIYGQSQGTSLSTIVSGIPTDGRIIYVRLWSLLSSGWQFNDYTYTAYSSSGTPAVLTTPTPGSTFAGSSVNFAWTAGSGVSQYFLYVGSVLGGNDIYGQSQGTSLSTTVSGIPTDGRIIYVRLWSLLSSGWQFNDYTYTAATVVSAHDFNGDGFSDVLFRDGNSGTVADWLMNGANIRSAIAVGVLASNWFVVGTGDFNGDGTTDILLRDSNSNTVAIWQMNGGTIQAALSVGVLPGNWSIVGTGDFNGDGTSDILLRDSNTNTVAIWQMHNNQVQAALAVGVLAGNWNIVGTGDFNGDGKTDILLQDSNSTTVAIWEMNGNQILAALAVSPLASNWKIVGTGDFDGDGTSDILLRDSNSNTVAIWQMKNGAMQMAVSVGVLPGNWQITETGDFNGDGTSDILLRDTNSNTVAVWEMNGNQILAALAVGVLAGNWQIQSLNTD